MEDMNLIKSQIVRAESLFTQGKAEEALALLNTLDDTGEMGGLICFALGNVYLFMGQVALAEENYSLAIHKGFVDFKVYLNLAGVSLRLNRPEQAEQHYRQASELDPTDIRPLDMICKVRLDSGNIEGAKAIADEMMQRYPALFEGFHHALGFMLLEGRAEDALAFLDGIEQRFSAHPLYITDRSNLLGKLGRAEEALRYLEEKQPFFSGENVRMLYTMARARLLVLLGDHKQAEPLLSELYTMLGDREAGFSLVGMAFERGDYPEAIRLADELTGEDAPRDPIYITMLYLRAQASLELGEQAAAHEALENIISTLDSAGDTISVEMRIMRVHALEELGRYEQAVSELDTITGLIKERGEDAPQDISAMLESIAGKRGEIAAKVGSFT